MSAVVVESAHSVDMDSRRPVQFMAEFFAALGFHVHMGICTASDLVERRFAKFAGVPYQTPFSRQQWEDLWQAEAEP